MLDDVLRCRGFSLLELLIVLSITAIISIISLSSYKIFFQKTEQEILSTQLMNAIHLTRSEAIMRHEKIILCGSRNQKTCDNAWQDGFIIVSESNEVLYTFPHIITKGQLHWRAFPLNNQKLEFLSSGFPHAENGTFWFCSEGETHPAWAMVMNQAGRVRMNYSYNSNKLGDEKNIELKC